MADHKNGLLDEVDEGAPSPEAQAPEPGPEHEHEAPEPEAQAEPEGGDKQPKRQDPRPDGYVTKGERDRIAQERDLYRDRLDKIVERFFKDGEQQSDRGQEIEPPEHPGQKPSAADSPYDWAIWREKKDAWDEYQASQREQQDQQQQAAHRQWQEAYTSVLTQFEEAKTAEPEIQGLYDGLRTSYAKEYQAYGYSMPQIAQLVERQEAQIIQWAHANRIPIGQAIKSLAASRGVQAPAAEPKPTPPQDPVTGQFVSPDADKAARQKESQERNASLSSAPGSSVKRMTAKELASMPEEEMWAKFESLRHKPGAKQFDRDMGFR